MARGSFSSRSPTAGESTKVHAKAFICGGELKPEEAKRKLQAANRGFVVQATMVEAATNEFYVEMIAAQTLQAESLGSMLAKKPEIDLLLRIAGTTQIARAIREMGAREGGAFLITVAGRSSVRKAAGLPMKELPRRTLTRAELNRIEKAALLGTERP